MWLGVGTLHVHLRFLYRDHELGVAVVAELFHHVASAVAAGDVGPRRSRVLRVPFVVKGRSDGGGGGDEKLRDWEFAASVTSFDDAPAPAQVGQRFVEGVLHLTGRCNTLIRRRGKTISPFIVESAMRELGFTMATLVDLGGRLVAVVETGPGISKEKIELMIREAAFDFDEVLTMKIPRDRRHYSKIDYEAVRRIVGKRLPLS